MGQINVTDEVGGADKCHFSYENDMITFNNNELRI